MMSFYSKGLLVAIALLVVLAISGCNPTKPADPLSKGLIAHFSFEGNAKDGSGNSYNGTAYGSPTYKKGAIGQAIMFDGKDDWIKLPARTHLLNGDFTLSMWVSYGPQNNGWGYAALFIQSIEKDSPWDGVSMFVSSKVMARLDRNQGLISKNNDMADSDAWHYLTLVRKANLLSLYLDGKLDNSRTVTHKKIIKPSPMFIGTNHTDHKVQLYKGIIDEMRIYDRALSADEIVKLFKLK